MKSKINYKFPSVEDLRKKAKSKIPKFAFEYLDGGCNDDVNLRKNTDRIRDIELKPKYLVDYKKPDFWHYNQDLNDKTNEILEQISLSNYSKEPAGLLSYADQRALEIGITIAGGAETILLDEPTAGMSKSETERATNLIRSIAKNRTVLIVEHDMGVVFDLSDTISVLVYGEVICSDKPEKVKTNKAVKEAYLGD